MARVDREKVFAALGYSGFIILVVAAIAYGMIPAVQSYAWVGWFIGALCIVLYVAGSLRSIKNYFKKRSTRHGANAVVLVLLLLGILVFVEAISARHSARLDLTANKRFTLSEQTIKVLKSIEEPVHVRAFYQEGALEAEEATDLLQQYAHGSRQFTYELVDPDRFPGEARRYKITSYGTLVLETGMREEKILLANEQKLTNALLRVTREGQKVIYFMTGHGEKSTDDQGKEGYSAVKEAVEDQNYMVRDLLLMRADEVPVDASVLVIAGPKRALMPEEASKLKQCIDQGGHLLILVDPQTDTGLGDFLQPYGIRVGKDTVVDNLSRIFGADYLTPIVSEYDTSHSITEGFGAASFFPLCRSVRRAKDIPPHVEITELAKTGESSWAETDLAVLEKGEATFDEEQDTLGPVPVAVVATIKHETIEEEHVENEEEAEKSEHKSDEEPPVRPARVVVFGDSDFASNAYLHLSGNRDLFMNALSWLAEEEDMIAIRPKERESRPAILSYTQGRIVFWASVVLLPGAVLASGIVVLRMRRASV